ncbi:MAG: hypothetical protein FWE31_03930 [Firmicutes bacterium]|nr:hypothetical protein [Bacillota bacterium]
MSLKDYASSSRQDSDAIKEPSNEKEVREAVGHYAKMSNDQLMAELVKHMAAKREKGDIGSVKETIDKIKPFLNAEQKKRLEVIVGQLGI